jgi:hypothetical protein
MSNQTLSRMALATIENYRSAANQANRAYYLSSKRLIGALKHTLESRVDSRTRKVAPELTSAMQQVRDRVTEFAFKGIDAVSSRTEKAVEFGSDGAAKQVTKLAELAAGVDNAIVANGLQTTARLTLPSAKLALAVSGKVAEAADALASAAGGKVANAAATAKRQAGRAQRRATAVSRKVAKNARTVAATAKKVVRAKRKQA